MGYPEASLRDPRDGSLSRVSYASSETLAGELAWYYERDGMRPMLIGHSQGGMLVVRTLHELAGRVQRRSAGRRSGHAAQAQPRTTIVDPYTRAQPRPVVGLRWRSPPPSPPARCRACCSGQWTMIPKLRKIPGLDARVHRFRDCLRSDRRQPRHGRSLRRDRARCRAQRDAAGDVQPHRRCRSPSISPRSRRRARGSTPSAPAMRCGAAPDDRQPSTCATSCTPPTCGTASAGTGAAKASADCARTGPDLMRGRLNLFQAAMLRWRELHPYNAVHVAELPGPLDAARRSRPRSPRILRSWASPGWRSTRGAGASSTRAAAAHVDRRRCSTGDGDPLPRARAGDGAPAQPGRSRATGSVRAVPLLRRATPAPRSTSASPTITSSRAATRIVALLKGIAVRYAAARRPAARRPTSIRRPTGASSLRNALEVLRRPVLAARDAAARAPRVPAALSATARAGTTRSRRSSCRPICYAARGGAPRSAGASRSTTCCSRCCCRRCRPRCRSGATRAGGARSRSPRSSTSAHELAAGPDRAFGQFLSSFLVSHRCPPDITLEVARARRPRADAAREAPQAVPADAVHARRAADWCGRS